MKGKENREENMTKEIVKKMNNGFEVNRNFLHSYSNSFHLFFIFYMKIK